MAHAAEKFRLEPIGLFRLFLGKDQGGLDLSASLILFSELAHTFLQLFRAFSHQAYQVLPIVGLVGANKIKLDIHVCDQGMCILKNTFQQFFLFTLFGQGMADDVLC